ncbi:hypothetical protein BTJ39_23395 [Izhakiella australiensis]|uniref:Protein CopB n=1 Tax=Izhakiella australiensis TaxID=1926881 RepID=A0A1S8Y7P6_9GAMM|nr:MULTISPECIES: replication regulatory protein RepA [Erwiniaceae]OON34713.1 hypothetical protein BTJ39_23395 [Izhakiella australiensis]PIJ50047.1 hypothetical protein BV501_10505 [Erwinia sp. OAMSP11]PIJ72407.1 hypothetical protein BK416_09290 [Erwinia sp. OLSSP12]PIJ80030.1 hypothetical protein BLD47_11860 [Erwinia sp. OLCASP19]PIJ82172.1 hypothetical protein BLD46_11875 [Erwinia sp. OLMTSP26]
MPQQQSTAAQPKQKRTYRKGNPLSDADKQRLSIARKKESRKEIKVFVEPEIKALLMDMCKQDGLNQADILKQLIEKEARCRGKH